MSATLAASTLLRTYQNHANEPATGRDALPTGLPLLAHRMDPQTEQIILAHVPQVRLIARSMWEKTRFAVELDDLIGYGMLGLLDAVRKFDPGRGVLLKTYAEHRIRGAMLDGLRGMDWLSRSARKLAKAPVALQEEASSSEPQPQHGGAQNATAGLAGPKILPQPTRLFCGGGVGDIERLYQAACPTVHYPPTPERLLERKQEKSALAAAIEILPERQRRVLEFYYRQEMSMKQIATLLGVHESRVSQIHLAAITRLRKSLQPKASRAASNSTLPASAPRSGVVPITG